MTNPVTIDPGRLRARLIVVLTAIMLLVVAMFGFASLSAFDRAIEPELENRTRLIGSIVRDEVQRTLDLGIPLKALGGIEAYIDEIISQFPEVKRIAVIQGGSDVIAEVAREAPSSMLERSGLAQAAGIGATDFSFPILVGNQLVGEIQVVGNPQFVETRLRDVFLDVSVLAIVALLVGVELSLAVAAASVWKPYGRVLQLLGEQITGNFSTTIRVSGVSGIRRAAVRLNEQAEDLARRLQASAVAGRKSLEAAAARNLRRMRYADFNDVRLALFLFATATEITASFLPIYARDATRPDWLSDELSAAAPLGLYLVAVALLAPIGGAISARFGARRLFVASTLPAAIALAGMAAAESLWAITLWRGLIGVFYALATIACQEYTIRAGRSGEAVQSSSAFVGMIFGGAFCGSVLGGVIGGRFGFPVALYFGAALAVISGIVAVSSMRGRAGEAHTKGAASPGRTPALAWSNRLAFWGLVLGIAIPVSATTAILIWYLAPLGLAQQGHDPATVARVVMLYYLASALLGPVTRSLTGGSAGAIVPVLIGAALSALTLIYFRSTGDLWVYVGAVAGCGIGHALIRAPMIVLAVQLCGGSQAMLGVLRLGERIGALVGLTASAFLLTRFEGSVTLLVLGTLTIAGSVNFAILMVIQGKREGEENEEPGAFS